MGDKTAGWGGEGVLVSGKPWLVPIRHSCLLKSLNSFLDLLPKCFWPLHVILHRAAFRTLVKTAGGCSSRVHLLEDALESMTSCPWERDPPALPCPCSPRSVLPHTPNVCPSVLAHSGRSLKLPFFSHPASALHSRSTLSPDSGSQPSQPGREEGRRERILFPRRGRIFP